MSDLVGGIKKEVIQGLEAVGLKKKPTTWEKVKNAGKKGLDNLKKDAEAVVDILLEPSESSSSSRPRRRRKSASDRAADERAKKYTPSQAPSGIRQRPKNAPKLPGDKGGSSWQWIAGLVAVIALSAIAYRYARR